MLRDQLNRPDNAETTAATGMGDEATTASDTLADRLNRNRREVAVAVVLTLVAVVVLISHYAM